MTPDELGRMSIQEVKGWRRRLMAELAAVEDELIRREEIANRQGGTTVNRPVAAEVPDKFASGLWKAIDRAREWEQRHGR